MDGMKIVELYSLEESIAGRLFSDKEYPWEVLNEIGDYILSIGPKLDNERFYYFGENVWVAKSAEVHPSADITGPAIIDEETVIRPSAFIRGNVVVGKNCVVGNSTEVKNSILFNNVEVPHYNYIGDSILGFHAHLGAGAITSNIKSDRTSVVIKAVSHEINTGLRKIGAMVGDYVEVGCNTVLNPGTVVGPYTTIYPLSNVRGVIPANSLFKNQGNYTISRKREV